MAAVTNHTCFNQPVDDKVSIWRYMDFAKYVALLQQKSLFLSRVDLLGDVFEGTVTPATVQLRKELFDSDNESLLNGFSSSRKRFRECVYVNCWHLSNHESLAMWRLYAKSNEAVCVQTTYDRLRELLPENSGDSWGDYEGAQLVVNQPNVYLGLIEYIDSEIGVIPQDNAYRPYMHKFKSFEHEREVRVLTKHPLASVYTSPSAFPEMQQPELPSGVSIPVDLDRLISSVRVSPATPSWFKDIVVDVSRKFGFNFDISNSILDRLPLY